MTAGARLVVLARPPQRGRAKSRLAADLGPGRAARLARSFLLDTWAAVSVWVSGQPEVDLVQAQDGEPHDYPLLLPTPTIIRQAQGDLGRRMATLTATALAQRGRVLLLGTDSPGLPVERLGAAVAALDRADIVLGPTRDGGFWCLGVRAGPPALWGNTWLDDLAWDSGSTLAAVQARATLMGLTVALAPSWFDVDHAADLERLSERLAEDPECAPATRAELLRPHDEDPLSVVLPTLNENIALDAALETLRTQPGPLELVVADGGSTDRSAERAAASGATVVVTAAGRGRQLAAGARAATGELLLFLHVDTRLPPDGLALVRATLNDPQTEAGAFRTHTVRDPRFPDRAGPLLRLADIRSRLTAHPYGDQALFVRRSVYEEVGGFRPLPILEDLELSRRLAARRPIVRLPRCVTVSGRRIQTRPLRALLRLRMIPLLYRLGVSPERLARLYRDQQAPRP